MWCRTFICGKPAKNWFADAARKSFGFVQLLWRYKFLCLSNCCSALVTIFRTRMWMRKAYPHIGEWWWFQQFWEWVRWGLFKRFGKFGFLTWVGWEGLGGPARVGTVTITDVGRLNTCQLDEAVLLKTCGNYRRLHRASWQIYHLCQTSNMRLMLEV